MYLKTATSDSLLICVEFGPGSYHIYLIKRRGVNFLSKSVERRLNKMGDYSKRVFIEHPVVGVEINVGEFI